MLSNPALYLDNLWDFDIFNPCFENPKIKFSDLDAIVEIGGRFLVLEFKSRLASIPTGQQRMIEALSKIECFVVLVVWGSPNQPEYWQAYHHTLPQGSEVKPCTLNQLQDFVSFWSKDFSFAEILTNIFNSTYYADETR
jgi:hypothetical protein